MKAKYTLVFDRKKEILKKGKGLVQIQVYLDGGRRFFSTKHYLTAKEWDIKNNSTKDPYAGKQLRERIEYCIKNEPLKALSVGSSSILVKD